MRRLARALLLAFALASLALTLWSGWQVWQSPGLSPLRERTGQEIVAATDRLMTREATAGRMGALIAERLAEDPRNWVTLEALHEVVAERGLAVDPAVMAAYDTALAEDTGVMAVTGDCLECLWDIAACSLSNVFICKAPLLLTPLEDLRGVAKAGWDYLAGDEVDQLDLGLSIVGLGATALVVFTGGSSETLKLGASAAKLARGMKVLSPGLERMALTAVRTGVDWPALARVGRMDDLTRAVRIEAFVPVADVATDLGRVWDATGSTATLHLLRYVDDAAEAKAMARVSEALGARTVARAEVLGPARLMRATLRVGELGWQLTAGLVGLVWALASMLGGAVQGAGLRALRRML